MGKRPKMSVLKRQRELKKAERQQAKREERKGRERGSAEVASRDDLAGYGFPLDEPEEEAQD